MEREVGKAGKWRRKWRRAPIERRSAAAESLGDLFRPRRLGGHTPLLLAVSLAVHVPLLLLVQPGRRQVDLGESARTDTYIRQVIQKERARSVSRDMTDRVTMPPPPPDPQAVVEGTLTTDISTDIERVIGKMLDVKVTGKLAARVTADLKAELAEASRQIAQGELSQAEIRRLQEQFKRKAHRGAVMALRRHREQTQVQHAKMNVTEWYEKRVSRALRQRLSFELFGRHYGRGTAWGGYFNRGGWDQLHEELYLRKLQSLERLARAEHVHQAIGGRPIGYGWRMLPDWPKCSADQAKGLTTALRSIHDRHPRGWQGSWDEGLQGYVESYCPHRPRLAKQAAGEIAAAWAGAFEQAQGYHDKAAAGADQKALTVLQKSCLAAIKALHASAAKLWIGRERAGQFAVVNRAVRSRVLRGPARERMYKRFADSLVSTFAPAIRGLAEIEFQEGIIIRRKGIDDLANQFADEVLTLLRRDVQRVLPRPRFDEIVFHASRNPYRSKVTGEQCAPGEEDIRRDEEDMAKVVSSWEQGDRHYADRRGEIIAARFSEAIDRVTAELTGRLIEEGRFGRRFYAAVESVDYTDKVEQRLDARARALAGRGQDLAELTDEGVPDPGAGMVALLFGAGKGHAASLEPVMTTMVPAHVAGRRLNAALRRGEPAYPPHPAPWARVTQPEVNPGFETPRCEGIPFLANFPRLDGDLSDWGRIRPLVLQNFIYQTEPGGNFLVYAAWNYQGFFFGYRVQQAAHNYCYPAPVNRDEGVLAMGTPRATYGAFAYGWAYKGDYFRLLFDTLDARGRLRGEAYLQEFVVLPRGTLSNPSIPGIERIIESQRWATMMIGDWHGNKASCKVSPPQPAPGDGPDGTGPYRVCNFQSDGYTVEVFLPRSVFNVPVFAPGWYMGFECVVAIGTQTRRGHGQVWGNPRGGREYGVGIERNDYPNMWGDLLLLGTDPRVAVQDADEQGSLSACMVPGHSYLLTVADPDRNVNLAAADTVVVSAEAFGARDAAGQGGCSDVEVFILKETGRNTSVFRGYVNTQPGAGREVQGVIEIMPGQEVRFGYVDLANARGERNVIYHLRLPVVAGISDVPARGK